MSVGVNIPGEGYTGHEAGVEYPSPGHGTWDQAYPPHTGRDTEPGIPTIEGTSNQAYTPRKGHRTRHTYPQKGHGTRHTYSPVDRQTLEKTLPSVTTVAGGNNKPNQIASRKIPLIFSHATNIFPGKETNIGIECKRLM